MSEYIMGIDEAGRGPVLGPMVYGCCYCKEANKEEVANMGFKDSKQLTERDRNILYDKIEKSPLVGYYVDVIPARELSEKMLRRQKYNLNLISHDSAIGLMRQVVATLAKTGDTLAHVYLDTVGDVKKYQAKLENLFPEITITVSKKADSLFPIVSAASIMAKVTRDRSMTSVTGTPGSGYPSDPNTKRWLRANIDPVFGFPSDIVRFSWGTTKKLLQAPETTVATIDWGVDSDGDEIDAEDTPAEYVRASSRGKGKAAKPATKPKSKVAAKPSSRSVATSSSSSKFQRSMLDNFGGVGTNEKRVPDYEILLASSSSPPAKRIKFFDDRKLSHVESFLLPL